MDTPKLLFSLIRSELMGNELSLDIKNSIHMESLTELYSLSAKHDLTHFLGNTLSNAGLLQSDKISEAFKKATLMAVYRYERSKYELRQICETLNNAQIPFIPLKGAVIRDYYPHPWMRTSCDIDILVHEEDLDKAVSCLVSDCKYVAAEKKNYHDISMHSPSGVHLELHFNIREDIQTLDRVLDNVWQYATISPEMPYKYEMTNEFLLFHVIAHLSYHFVNGGCGIRPIIDLWLLEKALTIDKSILTTLLSEAKLLRFYESVRELAAIWLENEAYTDIVKQMEDYVLRGGVYGTLRNKVLVQQQKKNGKMAYIIQRVFMPYDKLKYLYPVIIRHRWLIPFVQIHRWFNIIFSGRAKRSMRELSYTTNISKSQADEIKIFLSEIGL